MSLDVYLNVMKLTPVWEFNITHNLNKMAEEAGLYLYLWRPEELGITKAIELIQPLKEGLKYLTDSPEYFKKFNPENGWGKYEDLVNFVDQYLKACIEHPEALVEASR